MIRRWLHKKDVWNTICKNSPVLSVSVNPVDYWDACFFVCHNDANREIIKEIKCQATCSPLNNFTPLIQLLYSTMKHTLSALAAIQLGVLLPVGAQTDFTPITPLEATYSVGETLEIDQAQRIGFIGGGLGSRMNIFNEFETELQRRYPKHKLYIRNFCKEGDTPGFRPHPSRKDFYAFPGAKELMPEEFQQGQGNGTYPTPDQWLKTHKIDTLIGFFGYSSAFGGPQELETYKREFSAFIDYTKKQNYSGKGSPQLAIVSPAAFEDLSSTTGLPNGATQNENFELYTQAMSEICKQKGVLFIDAFSVTKGFYAASEAALTSNGHNLNSLGYRNLSNSLANKLFGKAEAQNDYAKIKAAVSEKNRTWLLDYKIPNGVHVHGGRHKPYGVVNYPEELKKTQQMTVVRDQAIWAANTNKAFDIAAADAKTLELSAIKSRGKSRTNRKYASGTEAIKKITMAPGYKIQLFADEGMFPNLANPSQMAFDNRGRLWVGCMGSYPHYKIGDPLPNDKILIFEDTDNDGVADKETIFVDQIHIPMGFEITDQGGAYVSLGNDLVHFMDTDGDGKADKKEFVLSGFDDHDTHHAISGFCADPSGAIYMGEGIFLHSNVETPHGTVRGSNGGFYRFSPKKGKLERTAQYAIPNPWGIAFNDWGQNFFLWTSGPSVVWMPEIAVKNRYNQNIKTSNILTGKDIRPTSGLEFVSSRHFPDEVQGDMILCNTIGFQGGRQHKVEEDKVNGGFKATWRHDLFASSDGNFRPVDLEFAPDGSLYVIDWQNVLIGHMQHSARDPLRDHVHGRIYRITYPSRPLVEPAKIAGASIEQLLENLKLPEYRTRYRTRRELRGREVDEVTTAINNWVASLDKTDEKYDHHLTEAMWVTWGLNQINTDLVEKLLAAKNPMARAAAVRSIHYNAEAFSNKQELLVKAASDEDWIVRHEAVLAASWLGKEITLAVTDVAAKQPVVNISKKAIKYARAHGTDTEAEKEPVIKIRPPQGLHQKYRRFYRNGAELYNHGESCGSCHGKNGEGIPGVSPPLAGSPWVTGDKELLAKIALHGITGELKVNGKTYNGAMPGFAHRAYNRDIGSLLTYVRNAFGNIADSGERDGYTEEEIETLLKSFPDTQGLHNAKDLAKEYKMKGQ